MWPVLTNNLYLHRNDIYMSVLMHLVSFRIFHTALATLTLSIGIAQSVSGPNNHQTQLKANVRLMWCVARIEDYFAHKKAEEVECSTAMWEPCHPHLCKSSPKSPWLPNPGRRVGRGWCVSLRLIGLRIGYSEFPESFTAVIRIKHVIRTVKWAFYAKITIYTARVTPTLFRSGYLIWRF